MKKNEMRRVLGTAPFGVLLVTPAALHSILTRGNMTADIAPRVIASDTAKAPRTTAKTAKMTVNRGAAGRGRTPGVYVAKLRKLAKDANPKVVKVFGFIQKQKKSGITQASIVKSTKLPNSTVWYALKRLQKDKAVEYRDSAAA